MVRFVMNRDFDELMDLLNKIDDFLNDQADASSDDFPPLPWESHDPTALRPNRAMRLQMDVREIMSRLQGA